MVGPIQYVVILPIESMILYACIDTVNMTFKKMPKSVAFNPFLPGNW